MAAAVLAFGMAGAALAADAPAVCVPTVTPSGDAVQKASGPALDRGFLWRLEKDGRSSWLYGTMHVGKPAWMSPGARVRAALRQSDILALELDLTDPATLAVFTEPLDAAVMARILTPDRQRRLDRQIALACLPAHALGRLRPILQATTLAGLAVRHDGMFSEWGSEQFLALHARSHAKPVVALEDARTQLRALTGDSEADEIAQVDETLDELESGQARAMGAELAAVWATSDWKKLSDYRRWCDCVKTPADESALQRLLDDRNPGLADGIARVHGQGHRVFAAVGALHMVGPKGLPALLAARGFRVTRQVPAP
ncbi:TraB/GumN family protein [Variovorax boronicumulans]|uniref:TraB/GumN family protein n=1 Tax=Variovorax boronicumulans TaxID=436515 RepID=UPI001C5A52D4